MEQNKYQHSDKLPLSLVVEELEKDAEFTDKALQILSVEDRGSTHTRWTAVSALISHWLTNRDLNCYINGKLVDDVTDLTVLPVNGDCGAGIKALENWMTIRIDELAALLKHKNLPVPAFLRPCVKVSKAADTPAAKVEVGTAITIHTLKAKNMPLDAEIATAKSTALDKTNVQSVWDELVKMANKQAGCLIGEGDLNELQYGSRQDPQIFKKKTLGDRMRRA